MGTADGGGTPLEIVVDTVWQDAGDVSVMPYAMESSVMFMSFMQRFMTSTGQTDPAMMPVRNNDKSRLARSGSPRIAMNIVGTP
jgi:hypothetical protein